MTGYGSRFVAAGYDKLKPFIEIQGKPIIQWIVEGIYPGESDFLFVCRKEHLDSISDMRKILLDIAPAADIFEITDWEKKGPVYDVLRASAAIDDNIPCIINYCDFYMTWDWEKFKGDVIRHNCDGSIPCYTGFHPHLLHEKNVYASCRTTPVNNLMEIREKYSFEKNKEKSKHSPGVYYFKTGAILKKYCSLLVESDQSLNGEFYASLPYNFMIKDGLTVWVPANVEQFCQWGTPEDLEEFLFWTNTVRRFINK